LVLIVARDLWMCVCALSSIVHTSQTITFHHYSCVNAVTRVQRSPAARVVNGWTFRRPNLSRASSCSSSGRRRRPTFNNSWGHLRLFCAWSRRRRFKVNVEFRSTFTLHIFAGTRFYNYLRRGRTCLYDGRFYRIFRKAHSFSIPYSVISSKFLIPRNFTELFWELRCTWRKLCENWRK